MISTGSNSPSNGQKFLGPGIHRVAILDISLRRKKTNTLELQSSINVLVAGIAPYQGFVGPYIDSEDPSKGSYSFPIANLSSGRFDFKHKEFQATQYKPAKIISHDEDAANWLGDFTTGLGFTEPFHANTLEELIQVVKAAVCKGEYCYNVLIAQREYMSDGKRKTISFLPERGKHFGWKYAAVPFVEGSYNPDFMQFDPNMHIILAQPATPAALPAATTGIYGGNQTPATGVYSGQQPAPQQPVYQQPVQQPAYQQPVQQPVYQQPVQQPVYQQPVTPPQAFPVQQPVPVAPAMPMAPQVPTAPAMPAAPTMTAPAQVPVQVPAQVPTQVPVQVPAPLGQGAFEQAQGHMFNNVQDPNKIIF